MTKEQKILLLFVLLAIGGGVTVYVSTQKSAPVSQVSLSASIAVNETKPALTTKSGTTYIETISYNVPYIETVSYNAPQNHTEEITVTVAVDSKGTIIDATFAYEKPTNRESAQYLGGFAKAFTSSMISGQSIQSVNLSRVAGASLTTNAFKKALTNIGARVNG